MKAIGDYTIRQLALDELGLLIPLFKNAFGLTVSIEFLNWKYKDNPAGSFIGFIAETQNGDLAGYYGVIPVVFILDKKPQVVYHSVDTMTHSVHRRKGLFELLAKTCYDYLKSKGNLFVIGFGGDFSTPGFLKLGWNVIDKGFQLFYPRVFSYLPAFKKCNYTIRKLETIADVGEMLEASNALTPIYSLKNKDTFGWRLKNPLHNYTLLGVFDEQGKVGYFVFYYYKNRIYLFDFWFKDKGGVRAMMKFFKDMLRERTELSGIQSFCTKNSIIYKTLMQNGFLKSPFKKNGLNLYLPFIFLATEDKMAQLKDARLWNLTPFDHDNL